MVMKRFSFPLPVVLSLLWVSVASLGAAERAYEPARREGGELRYVEGIPVLIIRGDPGELGRQQAALVGETVKRLAPLPQAILVMTGGPPWQSTVATATAIIGRGPERYRRELQALTTALKATEDAKAGLAVGNVVAELRRFERCSALIVEPQRSGTGNILFGRNYDFYTFGVLDRLGLVTVYRPNGYHAFASVGYPGNIGVLSGMNDAGLALGCLDSGPGKDRSPAFDPQGNAMLLTFRRVLEECATIEEAERLLRQIRHTTWFNLAVCDKRHAAVMEITPKQVVSRRAEDHLLACTNHFRTPELAVRRGDNRYTKLQQQWQRTEPFAWTDVARAMHEVNQGQRTLQTMVFEPEPLVLHLSLAARPASAGPFVTLELKELFKLK
jgi:isopenicillin-N N-acyltransferase like protein